MAKHDTWLQLSWVFCSRFQRCRLSLHQRFRRGKVWLRSSLRYLANFNFIYGVGALPAHMPVHRVQRPQKPALALPGLELQSIVSHHVGCGNWTRVFWTAAVPLTLNRLSSLWQNSFKICVFETRPHYVAQAVLKITIPELTILLSQFWVMGLQACATMFQFGSKGVSLVC